MINENDETENKDWINNDKKFMNLDKYKEDNEDKNE